MQRRSLYILNKVMAPKSSKGAKKEVNAGAEQWTATGDVDTARYGNVLRARRLVGVRGAGLDFDGIYYVKEVTHLVTRGKYRQRFTLVREGRGAQSSRVTP